MNFNEWLALVKHAAGPNPSEREVQQIGAVFTHFDPEDGHQTDFASGLMSKAPRIQRIEPDLVWAQPDTAGMIMKYRGIERHRLMRLLPIPFAFYPPVIYCRIEDANDSNLLVDGSHRYVAAAMQAEMICASALIYARFLPKVLWQHYVIKDFPKIEKEELLGSWSGLE